ncbi:MAG: thioesterase family protein [Sphingomonas sp.]|jgi:4-hydroxybenzoyl-CoA thioesterase
MSFSIVLPIRFGDCDFAGIAYYPRLLALVDAAIEDWTSAVIGVDRATMHGRDRRGLPTVKLTTSFEHPCRLGEEVTFTVQTVAAGTSSVTLEISAEVAGAPRFTAQLVQVLMDIEHARKAPWPPEWRSRLEAAAR